MREIEKALALFSRNKNTESLKAFRKAFQEDPSLLRTYRPTYEIVLKRLSFPSPIGPRLAYPQDEPNGKIQRTTAKSPDKTTPPFLNGEIALKEYDFIFGNRLAHESSAAMNFGAAILGPLLSKFFSSIRDHIKQNNVSELFFLSREGWFLQYTYNKLADAGKIKKINSTYLLTSRNLLFRILFDDAEIRKTSTSTHFTGTIRSFLQNRISLSEKEIAIIEEKSTDHQKFLNTRLRLPANQEQIEEFLDDISKNTTLAKTLNLKRKLYLEYLRTVGFLKNNSIKPNIIDIGYSGTIQKCLYALTKQPSIGHYMFTTPNAHANPALLAIGHLLDRVNFGTGHSLLDKSLYLESLLTAPHGRIDDIGKSEDGGLYLSHAQPEKSQKNFETLNNIIFGAIDYAIKNIDHANRLSMRSLDLFYEALTGDARTLTSEYSCLFEIEDLFSGNAKVNLAARFDTGNG